MRDAPDVHAGVERSRDPFDHDHGALQQDQLCPRFHPETLGHVEQIAEQPRHGDAGGIHAKDRLAHGAQRAGEFIHVAIGWHIARLEMHLGHAPVIAPDEAIKDLCIDAPGVFIDMAHDSKIIGDDVAIGRHLQVPLMHVGVEESVAQGMVEKELQNPLAERDAVMSCGVDRGIVPKRHAFRPAHGHHPPSGQAPDHLRQGKACIIGGVGGKFTGGGAFQPEIQLAHHHAFEMGDHVPGPQAARGRRQEFDHIGGEPEGIHIATERAFDPGPQHLDRDRLPRFGQPRLVDLRDGGGRDGGAEFGKDLIHGQAKLGLDLGLRGLGREGGQLVLQHPQLIGKLVADHVRPGRKHLPELDIGGAKGRKGARRRGHRRVAFDPEPFEGPAQHPRGDAQRRRGLHRVQHHTHRPRALQRGAGAHEPPDIVRSLHPRSSSPNAGRRCQGSGCDTWHCRSLPP